jgi:hypothetical protein
MRIRFTKDLWDTSRPEFAKLFARVDAAVELKGATSAISIENRLKVYSFDCQQKSSKAR